MTVKYETDIVAWANEQAELIRTGQFNLLDLEHLAEEIEGVSKSERNELANRMAILLTHLLKWEFQPRFRASNSWRRTIKDQRDSVEKRLRDTPSLKPSLDDADWIADVWRDAVRGAVKETRLVIDTFPENCPWSMVDVLTVGWMPSVPEIEQEPAKKSKRSTRKKTAA
jgi:Domain of unknown function DUF29